MARLSPDSTVIHQRASVFKHGVEHIPRFEVLDEARRKMLMGHDEEPIATLIESVGYNPPGRLGAVYEDTMKSCHIRRVTRARDGLRLRSSRPVAHAV